MNLFSDEEARYLFHQGTNFSAYTYLGVSVRRENGKYLYAFRVWAPNADGVALVCDFCGWENPIDLKKITHGIWELFYESGESLVGAAYKYLIRNGENVYFKGDPFAFFSRGGADGASIIYSSEFQWTDGEYLDKRKKNYTLESAYLSIPINIYELHLASFMRNQDGGYLNYREIADFLVEYIKYMGYTHVEIMPIYEYPYDGSWGYQVGAFFAPSTRFGTPDDLRYMINRLHGEGIGVIFDWVAAHFPKDAWGLYEFDGQTLYEYQGKDKIESKSWGTRFFDIGREEVQCFLISNALYWLREFHIDGLRVDAVASMLYLDYDKSDGEWCKNSFGGKESLEAISFFKKLNTQVFKEFPEALMIAEESGDYGRITQRADLGGLGFNLKWNMGWANDFFDYLKTDPYFRAEKHSALTFPIMYAFSENYVLPISHDEVVHGKNSFIDKGFGSYEDKFRTMRTALMLMMTYPGKKLTFMGTEFAQFREWDFSDSLEWFMLDYPIHRDMRDYVAALNRFYLAHAELWTYDFSHEGFEWISCDDGVSNTVAFKRNSANSSLIIALSFSNTEQTVKIKLKNKKAPRCIFSTDFGDVNDELTVMEENGQFFVLVSLGALSGRIFSDFDNIKFKI